MLGLQAAAACTRARERPASSTRGSRGRTPAPLAAAVGLGKEEPAAVEIVARASAPAPCARRALPAPGLGCRTNRAPATAASSSTVASRRSETCQVMSCFHLPFDVAGQVGHVVAVAVPIVGRAVFELVQQHRPTPFREKQQGKTGADHGIRIARRPAPSRSPTGCPGLSNQMLGALAIPIGPARLAGSGRKERDEPLGGEPADPFQAVEVVEHVVVAGAGVVRDGIILAEPLQAAVDAIVILGVVGQTAFDAVAGLLWRRSTARGRRRSPAR